MTNVLDADFEDIFFNASSGVINDMCFEKSLNISIMKILLDYETYHQI